MFKVQSSKFNVQSSKLLYVGFEVIDIEDAQFERTNHQTGSIDTLATGEEFANQFHLSFLQTLYAKRHATKARNLLLGESESQMTQEALIILVNLIVN